MPGKITLQSVKALQPGETIFDSELTGFQVRRQRDAIVYSVRRKCQGRNQRLPIGEHGAWTPTTARKEAERLLRELGVGNDPRASRTAATTLRAAAVGFMEHIREKRAPRTARGYQDHLDQHLLPKFGSLPLDRITTEAVEKLHLGLKRHKTLANHVVATLSSLYGWADGKLVPRGFNPCSGVERYKLDPRNCQLEDDAIESVVRVLRECKKEGRWSPFALAGIELYLLTGLRRDAVRTAKWEHVDWERNKVKVQLKRQGLRAVHFSDEAMAVLRRLRADYPDDGNPYIIRGSQPGEPYKNMQDVWDHVRQRAGLDGIRIHDMRHTVGSIVGETNNPKVVMEALGQTSVASAMRYIHTRGDAVEREMKRVGAKVAEAGK
jgi:integrase